MSTHSWFHAIAQVSRAVPVNNTGTGVTIVNLDELHQASLNAHAVRHTYAYTLASANIDALVLQNLMGHSRSETTAGYFTLADDTKVRQYFSAMEFARGPEA